MPTTAAPAAATAPAGRLSATKLRFILFGRFPYARAMAAAVRRADLRWIDPGELRPPFVGRRLILACGSAGLTLVGVLMWGGIFGLSYVETDFWSGLPLTLILASSAWPSAFPLAILLALGRRSELPAVRAICVAYIELIRGVPLITVLFMASVMFPLFLPTGVTIDKLLRAQVAFILFAAAYLAEVVRGGLQAIPKGQIEAADALGLSYWQKTRLIILPQALATGDPALGQHLHRLLQGHLAGHHHRAVRSARHGQGGVDRRQLAGLLSPRSMSSWRRSTSRSASSCRATARCSSANSTRADGASGGGRHD